MSELKTEHVTIRLRPTIKAALERLAAEENRSIANLLETMVLERERVRARGVSAGEAWWPLYPDGKPD